MSTIAFFKEFELVGKFFKKGHKKLENVMWPRPADTYIESRLPLLHAENFKIILSLQKQLNL